MEKNMCEEGTIKPSDIEKKKKLSSLSHKSTIERKKMNILTETENNNKKNLLKNYRNRTKNTKKKKKKKKKKN